MECDQSREWLAVGLAGQLPADAQQQLDAHLAQCPACQREAEAVRQLWQALGQLPPPEPSTHVRPRFYAVLAEFEAAAQRAPWPVRLGHWLRPLVAAVPVRRLAYNLLLVGGGIAIGTRLHEQPRPEAGASPNLVVVTAPAPTNEQQIILARLTSPSAMQRLQAVGQTRDLVPGNHKVVGALLRTLTQDPNVNVRLATLEALAQLGQDPVVRQGLVYALTRQESPLVQAALADALGQLQERRSVPPLRVLLQQPNLDPAVKSKIEQTIHTLSDGLPLGPATSLRHDQTSLSPRPERPVAVVI